MNRTILRVFSILALGVCLGLAWSSFMAKMPEAHFKFGFLFVSLLYFIAAIFSLSRGHSKKKDDQESRSA